MKDKKKWIVALTFVGLALINCGMFPFVNLTKEQPIKFEMINWLMSASLLWFYCLMGKVEATLFANKSGVFICLFNLLSVVVGLGSRFLIEFGEVSNTYNFTLPNIILQVSVVIIFSFGILLFMKSLLAKK